MKVPLKQVCRFRRAQTGLGSQATESIDSLGAFRGGDSAETWGVVHDGKVWGFHLTNHPGYATFSYLLNAADLGRLPAELEVSGDGVPLGRMENLPTPAADRLLAPIDRQEVWAAGVTYLRSREARKEESKQGGDFYQLVYDADRPELFFKATPNRCVGPGDEIVIRKDSDWNVPEPELTLVITPGGKLFGFTVGDDVSSRSIEGANPLYLPQAKLYKGAAALGPVITLASAVPDPRNLAIRLTIHRGGEKAWSGETSTNRLKRQFPELIDYLLRDNEFPDGVFLMTGTGIVPDSPFTLTAGDLVEIEIEGLGVLRNKVRVGRP
jgi:2-dehydro-3-deoxy-D-arabinonate dehydratase